MIGKYQNFKLLTCISPSGVFEQGQIYPFCLLGGNAYMVMIDKHKREPVLFALDSYEDGTYKIIGTYDNLEDAVFKEVN